MYWRHLLSGTLPAPRPYASCPWHMHNEAQQHWTYWERYGCFFSISSHSSEKQPGTNFWCIKLCSRNSPTLRQGFNQESQNTSVSLWSAALLVICVLFNELQLRIYLWFLFVLKRGLGLQSFLSLNSLYAPSKQGNREYVSGMLVSKMNYFLTLKSVFFWLCFPWATLLFLHCRTIGQLLGLCICLYLIKISNSQHSKHEWSKNHWSNSSVNFVFSLIWFFFQWRVFFHAHCCFDNLLASFSPLRFQDKADMTVFLSTLIYTLC